MKITYADRVWEEFEMQELIQAIFIPDHVNIFFSPDNGGMQCRIVVDRENSYTRAAPTMWESIKAVLDDIQKEFRDTVESATWVCPPGIDFTVAKIKRPKLNSNPNPKQEE